MEKEKRKNKMEDLYDGYIEALKAEVDKLNENIELVKTKIDYPFERIEDYLENGDYLHIGYVKVEKTSYKCSGYSSYDFYNVVDNELKIPDNLMRQDDNDDDTFHCLIWQTCGYLGDNYSGYILFPLTDGTYWVLQFEM